MLIPITKLPARILRNEVKDVHFPLKRPTVRLLKDMLQTCRSADGIGLAATQVGESLNLALINLEEQGLPPFIIINPKVTSKSKAEVVIEEGCLSMPGVYGEISRPKEVTVEFFDAEGKKHTITDDGWIARVVQHEIDHLNGVLIIDKFKKVTQGIDLLPKYKESRPA
jgi:peptide deformylase